MNLLTKVRIVVLTNTRANQLALVNKLSRVAKIAAVVFSNNIPRRKPSLSSRIRLFSNSAAGRLAARELRDTWIEVRSRYAEDYPGRPIDQIVYVRNVNDEASIRTITDHQPDLVVVSGTNIVGSRVIAASQATGGIINLHTGISPYVKGGPNCTNWCLAKTWFHLIGNTVMWLDKGVDTGDIIATEQTLLNGHESLFDLHWKVMEHAQDLYVRVVDRIGQGKQIRSVQQRSIAEGVEFRTVDWNVFEMRRALRNFRVEFKHYFTDKDRLRRDTESINLVPLTDA